MKVLKRYVLGVLLAFVVLASMGAAVDYPKAVEGKYLYDTAGILTAQEYSNLNAELVNYQQKTTAAIVVVTTQSLQGQSLEDYARGLFNFWGVGRADVNNGVLILLSLDEDDRGVRIELGDGVYIDTDPIIGDDMIPYFRNQQWYDGLSAGVEAAEQSLPASWPAAAASPQASGGMPVSGGQAEASGGSDDGSGFLSRIIVILGATVFFAVARWIILSRARAKKAAEEKAREQEEFKTRNLDLAKGFRDQLAALEGALIPAQKTLDKLKESYPESLWGTLAKDFAEINANALQTAGLEIDLAEADAQKNENPKTIGDELTEAGRKLDSYSRICANVAELLKKADKAKGEAQSALQRLPERIVAAQREMEDKDVTDKARGLLGPVVERFPTLKAEYEGKDPKEVDWIQANIELGEMNNAVSNAVTQAREDRELAERARIEGPKMLAKMDEIQRQLDEKAEAYRDSRSAQAEIAAAREKITEVQQYSSRNDSTDWVPAYLLMNAINSHNDEADRAHHSHVQRVEQQRRGEQAARVAEETRRRNASTNSSSPFQGGHSGNHSSGFSGGHSGGRGGSGRF